MHSEVSNQTCLVCPGLVTFWALEWLLSTVHSEVDSQIILGPESFLTFRALEWLLNTMHSEVGCQLRLRFEGFVTLSAFVGSWIWRGFSLYLSIITVLWLQLPGLPVRPT